MRFQIDPTKVELKTRKRMVFKDFMGIDALSPVYSIDSRRASKMCNLISRDGCNHKRYGWQQYLKFSEAINGVFRFTINSTKFDVVYSGTSFWMKRTDIDDSFTKAENCTYITDSRDTNLFKNRECKCYIQNDKAYFIGMGDFIVFSYDKDSEKYKFARVLNNSDTYIPTTTENISCMEQDEDSDSNPITYSQRYTGEDINVLNGYRKNRIIGSQVGGAIGDERTYQLDLLPKEIIDPSSVKVEGYDYDPSTGLKNGVHLKASSSTNVFTNLSTSDTVSLDTVDGKLIIQKNARLPLTDDWGIDNAKTLCKGKYTDNGIDLYSYEIKYYMEMHEHTAHTQWFDIEYTRYHKYAYLSISVTKGATTRTFTEQLRDSDDLGSLMYRFYLNNNYAIDIKGYFESAGLTLDGHESDITTYEILNETEDGTTYKYLSYISDSIELVSATNSSDTSVYGYLVPDTGKLILATDSKALYARSIAGEANITVTFFTHNVEESRKITESSISTIFGIGGNALALFVSGYENAPNKDWWSKELDYTYFPSGNECSLGTENTKVMGYQVLGDSSLAIFKGHSDQEPSVYIRSGTETQMTQADDGTISIAKGGYYTAGKYMSKGVIAPKSIAVLQSDPMVLTQDGVCALTIDANTSSISNRVFRERSRLIDNIINNHANREEARAFVHDGKYFLCINGDVYVADSRYTFNIKGDMTDTFNYEWWIWDNCPMYYIFENEDGELCFGTATGEICKFYKGFEDMKFEKNEVDNIAYSQISGASLSPFYQISFDVNGSMFLQEGKEYYIKSNKPLYVWIQLNNTTANFYEGAIVRKTTANSIGDTDYEVISERNASTGSYEYKLRNISTDEEETFNSVNTYVATDIRNRRFKVFKSNLFYAITDSKLYDVYKNEGNTKIKQILWGRPFDYALTSGGVVVRTVDIVEVKAENVSAYWYSPALDFGTNDYEKVMLSVTIATERVTNGKINFGWETRTTNSEMTSKGMDTFNFEEVDFNRIALDTSWNTSYTKLMKSVFNFIMYRFYSDNDVDCCVHQFTIGYKVNKKNLGVK